MSEQKRPTAEHIARVLWNVCLAHEPMSRPFDDMTEPQRRGVILVAERYLAGGSYADENIVDRLRLAECIAVLEQENAALRAALAGNPQPIDMED